MYHNLTGNVLPFFVLHKRMLHFTIDGILPSINRAHICIIYVLLCLFCNPKGKLSFKSELSQNCRVISFCFIGTNQYAPSSQAIFSKTDSKNCAYWGLSAIQIWQKVARIDHKMRSTFKKCTEIFFPCVILISPKINVFNSAEQSNLPFRSTSIVLYTINAELKLWNLNPFLP